MTVDFTNEAILAPLTKGGNLPFRRLCVHFGARITTSEMAYARQVVRGRGPELALLRKHADEPCFGVQIATNGADEAVKAGMIAIERGAEFVDLNVGCPIHDVVRRGMGAAMLRKPNGLVRVVETMVAELPVPVTVKIRSGWTEGKTNAVEIAKSMQEAGVAALTVHPRSREQRYSKAADWGLVAEIVSTLDIPVIGNGDLLTYYEVAARRAESGCAAVMLARGALIKPWLFREIFEGATWEPTAEERVGVYHLLVTFMKEHFRDDEKGHKRAMYFLPWHFDFFSRYRPLPESEWAARAAEHPLMQTRLDSGDGDDLSLLETLLRDPRPEMHKRIAEALWASASADDAVENLTALGREFPPSTEAAAEMTTSNG